MLSISRSQKVFKGIDYFGNFLGEPIKIGNIYKCDSKSFILLAHITDLIPEISLTSITTRSKSPDLTYTKQSHVSVKAGGKATSGVGRGELQLDFKKKNSAFVALKDVTITQLKMELILEQLRLLWKSKRFSTNGTHLIVNQVLAAKSGTVIFSQDRNNKVVLKAKGDELLSSALHAASGNVEFVINTKATLEIISKTTILPMFKGVYLDRRGRVQVAK